MKLKIITQQRKSVKQITGCYRKKLNKINKPLSRLIKIKRKDDQHRNKSEDVATDPTAIKRIIRKSLDNFILLNSTTSKKQTKTLKP